MATLFQLRPGDRPQTDSGIAKSGEAALQLHELAELVPSKRLRLTQPHQVDEIQLALRSAAEVRLLHSKLNWLAREN